MLIGSEEVNYMLYLQRTAVQFETSGKSEKSGTKLDRGTIHRVNLKRVPQI